MPDSIKSCALTGDGFVPNGATIAGDEFGLTLDTTGGEGFKVETGCGVAAALVDIEVVGDGDEYTDSDPTLSIGFGDGVDRA